MHGPQQQFEQFTAHLGSLTPERLADLLRRRPDVLWPPPPRDLSDLAGRLDDPSGLAGCVVTLSTPGLQLLSALAAAGENPRQRLLDLLGTSAEALQVHLDGLLGQALAWEADGLVHPAPSLHAVLQAPLALGPSLDEVLPDLTATTLEAALRGLGVPPPKPRNKASMASVLREALRDEQRVRRQLAQAPAPVRQWLEGRMGAMPDDSNDPAAWRLAQQSLHWAQAHGLALPHYWGHLPVLPSEVGVALRPGGAPLPFSPEAPPVVTHAVAPETVASASAAALAELLATTTALLDELDRGGAALLRSGGVGTRELTRLSKALGTDVERVRLALELADALELFDTHDVDRLYLDEAGRGWRDQEPTVRTLSLLAAWLEMGALPTAATQGGKTRPALVDAGECAQCLLARHAVLAALTFLGPGEAASAGGMAARLVWRSPSAHSGAEGGDAPFARHWHEAELVGMVAAGAISPVGRLLLSGDPAGAGALLRQVLPTTVEEVLFGADLTAVVPGDPSASVTRLLDGCADREGRGGAVVWRLSPGSIRRALDAGSTGEELVLRLEGVAAGSLPQPLRYLVDDVARSHGVLRVRTAVCLVRSDDVALLAQVCADRALRKHGLSLVAPTVASSTAAPDVLLTALRGAGYLPMPEGPDGVVALAPASGAPTGQPARRREQPGVFDQLEELFGQITDGAAPDDLAALEALLTGGDAAPAEPAAGALDVDALARSLLARSAAQPRKPPTPPPPRGERTVERPVAPVQPAQRSAPEQPEEGLTPGQQQLLDDAVSQQGTVEIDYRTAVGTRSTRVVSDARIVNGALVAWCHVAEAERTFKLDQIVAVRPAP